MTLFTLTVTPRCWEDPLASCFSHLLHLRRRYDAWGRRMDTALMALLTLHKYMLYLVMSHLDRMDRAFAGVGIYQYV
jgi:hypothetical protein